MSIPHQSVDLYPWFLKQPWAADLRNTSQDPVWHAEGDVLTHTKMVYDIVQGLSLPEPELWHMSLLALFHDVAKPECTITDGNQIRSPGHGRRGAQKFNGLMARELSPQTRIMLYHLIRLHGKPMHAFDKLHPDQTLALWSQDCKLSDLLSFVRADILGRVCGDQKTHLDNLTLLEGQALEMNCLQSPYKFYNEESKIWANSGRLATLDQQAYFNNTHQVIMLMGLPGSGKDHYYAKHLSQYPALSLDNLRRSENADYRPEHIYQIAKERAKQYLAHKQTFVFNATNLTRNLRLKWLNLFYQYGAHIQGIYIEPNFTKILAQNKNREHVVPEAVITGMLDILEYPSACEFHTLTHVVDTAVGRARNTPAVGI